MSVLRCYSQKKTGFDVEAQGLLGALRDQLGIRGLESVVILNRYDADQIDPAIYEQAKGIVFSEPQVDAVYDETFPVPEYPHRILAVEALPGQFDQRADSAAQCIQLMAGVDRPLIAYAKVYLLGGRLTEEELDKIRRYLINPVESREASMDKPATLVRTHEAPDHVAVIQGFTTLDEPGLAGLLSQLGLAMDLDDLKFLQAYFRDEEKRDPTITEVRVVDTYWSDHCRHTTFSTHIDRVEILDPRGAEALGKPVGTYLTLDLTAYWQREEGFFPRAVEGLGQLLRDLLPEEGSVLVVGLGNAAMTADAVGPETLRNLLITRHLMASLPRQFSGFRQVSAFAAGVLGDTGVESAEAVSALVRELRPDCVIAVDALAARKPGRVCTTVQLSDTGIAPGSGVGNHRAALTKESLGVPVYALGVPTVVDAWTLAADLLESAGVPDWQGLLKEKQRGMTVTPRDIDRQVRELGRVLGYALTWALQDLDLDAITSLLG